MAHARLKPLALSDLSNLMTWVNDLDVVGNFAAFDKRKTEADEREYIEKIVASDCDRVFSVEDEQGNYIGQAGIFQIHWPTKLGRLGLIISDKAKRGMGYGQSAIREIQRVAFEEMGLHKLWLMVFEENARARHVYQKAGFLEEGVLKEEYLLRGRYHNIVRMAILESEYFARRDAK